jgi:hypothetical protein
VPDAPARGLSLSISACESAWPAIGICPCVEGDAARRAVELALAGEPERVLSVPPRKDEDGMGLAFGGEAEGLLSLFVNRPAIS